MVHPRFKAAAIHLLISLCAGIALFALIWLGWYPKPLSRALEVGHVVAILLAVDVCLGPLLTLVVFNPKKRSLKLDLAVIAVFQIAGFLFGIHTLHEGRPAWLVFNQDRFEVTRPADLDSRYASPSPVPLSWLKPQWAAIPLLSASEKSEYFTQVVKGAPDLAQRINMFQPIDSSWKDVEAKSLPLKELDSINSPEEVQAILTQHPWAKSWLPLQTQGNSLVVLLGTSAAQKVVVNLRGWKH